MKHLRIVVLSALCGALFAGLPARAEKIEPGPKGGRLLSSSQGRAEFFVAPGQRAEIVFYDEGLRPVGPGSRVVTITAEAPGGRVVLDLEPTATGFVSRQPLPDGHPYRLVVQIRSAPGEKPQNHRLELNLAVCGGCSRAEYACTCDGH